MHQTYSFRVVHEMLNQLNSVLSRNPSHLVDALICVEIQLVVHVLYFVTLCCQHVSKCFMPVF